MQELSTLGLSGGINTDTDKTYYDGKSYLYAENFTSTQNGGNTLGAFENSRGNELIPEIDFGAGYEVVGYANVVKDIVFFVGDGTNSKIYHYKEDGSLVLKYSDEDLTDKLDFKLDPENRIVAVGRQELLELNKVYWIDGIHQLRYINLERDYTNDSGDFINRECFESIPETSHSLEQSEGTVEVIPNAGTYTTGKVFYSYQFYNFNGSFSTYALPFGGIDVSKFAGSKIGGSDIDEVSNAAVRVAIKFTDDIDTEIYSRIRFVSIYYTDLGIPQIGVFKDIDIQETNNTSYSVIDLGTITEEITLEEFATTGQSTYIPQAISSKDNHLFLGNILEPSFTSSVLDDPNDPNYWDARAYRWNWAGNGAYIHNADATNYIRINQLDYKVQSTDVPGLNPGDDIPVDYDCRNLWNNNYSRSYADRYADARYSNDSINDGSSQGAEGINVKILEVNSDSDKTYNVQSKHGEVYRIGIIFYNDQGQRSFVKWICDYLLSERTAPNFDDNMRIPQVELKNLPQDPQIKSYQIVRAKRNSYDKSIVASGIMEMNFKRDGWEYNYPYPYWNHTIADHWAGSMEDGFLWKLVSPELMFNNPDLTDISSYKVSSYTHTGGGLISSRFGSGTGAQHYQLRQIVQGGGWRESALDNLSAIDNYTIVEPQYPNSEGSELTYSIGGAAYKNTPITARGDEDNWKGAGCRGPVVKLTDEFVLPTSGPTDYLPDGTTSSSQSSVPGVAEVRYFNLISNVEISRYGGVDYNSILNTDYIPYSKACDLNDTALCTQGDVYTFAFDYMATMLDYNNDAGGTYSSQTRRSVRLQNSINVERRLDRITDYIKEWNNQDNNVVDWQDYMWIQETVQEGIRISEGTYDVELGDLYRYNTVHSKENDSVILKSRPRDFVESPHSSVKVISSQKKINGESIDSWLQFLPNDFLEVDAAFGPLTTLNSMDNGLYFWQDKAFGKLAVNERSLIEDGSGAKLALGTGGVLERYDYYTTEIGNLEKYNVSKSESALLWLYTPKKSIFKFDGQLHDMSTTRAVSKLINDNTGVNPISISDYEAKESVIKIDDKVLTYDWMTDRFMSTYTYIPKWFVPEFDGNFMSSPDGITFYRHNSDNVTRANYYGVDNKSTITHVCSSNPDSTKVFDVMNWQSRSTTGDTNNFGDTFDRYRMYNEYQNTDWQDISWKRKERSFTTIIPRSRVAQTEAMDVDIFDPANLSEAATFKPRMRDKYLAIDLEYTNKPDTTFSFPYLNVVYRRSIR